MARQAHNLKVTGSNPVPATKLPRLDQSLQKAPAVKTEGLFVVSALCPDFAVWSVRTLLAPMIAWYGSINSKTEGAASLIIHAARSRAAEQVDSVSRVPGLPPSTGCHASQLFRRPTGVNSGRKNLLCESMVAERTVKLLDVVLDHALTNFM
jgi:hypothetical protein